MKHLIFRLRAHTLSDRAKQQWRCERKFSPRPPWSTGEPAFHSQMYIYPYVCTHKSVSSPLLTICLGLSHGQSRASQEHDKQACDPKYDSSRYCQISPGADGRRDASGTASRRSCACAHLFACPCVGLRGCATRERAWAHGHTRARTWWAHVGVCTCPHACLSGVVPQLCSPAPKLRGKERGNSLAGATLVRTMPGKGLYQGLTF